MNDRLLVCRAKRMIFTSENTASVIQNHFFPLQHSRSADYEMDSVTSEGHERLRFREKNGKNGKYKSVRECRVFDFKEVHRS